jgi:hypothetical protein
MTFCGLTTLFPTTFSSTGQNRVEKIPKNLFDGITRTIQSLKVQPAQARKEIFNW